MENATKALLIAAAVLIAILIIGLGVGIFNQGDAAGSAKSTGNQIEAAASSGITSLNAALVNALN